MIKISRVVALLFIALRMLSITLADGACPFGWKSFNYGEDEQCITKAAPADRSWSQCKAFCGLLSAHMVCIENAAKNALVNTLRASDQAWIGYTDDPLSVPGASEGNFRWIDECTSDYTNWSPGNPDNHNDEQHYAYFWDDVEAVSGQWDDGSNIEDAQCICQYTINDPDPTAMPIPNPTVMPIPNPTVMPIPNPTVMPVPNPTFMPTTVVPTSNPTSAPTFEHCALVNPLMDTSDPNYCPYMNAPNNLVINNAASIDTMDLDGDGIINLEEHAAFQEGIDPCSFLQFTKIPSSAYEEQIQDQITAAFDDCNPAVGELVYITLTG